MNQEMSQKAIRNLDKAIGPFCTSLRYGYDFDEDEFQTLCDALRECAKEWKSEDCIPKIAFSLLVDLPSIVRDFSSDNYEGSDEWPKVEKASQVIYELVMEAAGSGLDNATVQQYLGDFDKSQET